MKTRIRAQEKGAGEVIYQAQAKSSFWDEWLNIYKLVDIPESDSLEYAKATIDKYLADQVTKTSYMKYP